MMRHRSSIKTFFGLEQTQKDEKHEIELISKLRDSVQDLSLDEWHGSDVILLSWIQYGKFNLVKAEQALRQNAEWRNTYRWAALLRETFPEEFEELLPFNFPNFVDKNGWPVLILRAAQFKLKTLLESECDETQVERYFVSNFVKLDELLKIAWSNKSNCKNSKPICTHGGTVIIDCGGFPFGQVMSRNCLRVIKHLVTNLESNFPRPGFKFLLLNLGRISRGFFKIVTSFLPPETVAQFHWMGSDREEWRQELAKYLDTKNIPVEFGGEM